MKKINYNEHLDYILKNTTPYQRMIWLKKAFEFWKTRGFTKQRKFSRVRKTLINPFTKL